MDIYFWPKDQRCPKSQERFKSAFKYELDVNPEGIPHWTWGLAHAKGLTADVPKEFDVPKDFD